MSDTAISVKNVSKTFKIPHEKVTSIRGAAVGLFSRKRGYEEFKALDDVSFEVKKGEFFGIIGRNGSGKSTLLKILAGIYQPDAGKIKIDGMISPFLELGIGFNPELSGRDNVYLNATVLGMTKKQIDEKFDSIVKFSELERFIDQKLKNYSSGMQVRLAFSVSIHANRDILLMDEVLAVGDSNFQAKCIREFTKYKDMGRTVIIVTHDISVVQRYCDRAMLLRNGKIKEIGKADEVADKYVFDNISDEEKRIAQESKGGLKKGNSKEIKRAVKIKNVEFLDRYGKRVNTIKTHDRLEVRVYFDVSAEFREEINLGISFESGDGQYIFGYTAETDNFMIDNGKKYVSLVIDELLLLRGVYKTNATIVNKNSGILIDARPKIGEINVFSIGKENEYKGFLSLEHSWRQE